MKRGLTSIELLTVMAVVALVFCLTAPAIQHSQDRRNRAACKNNLKQIGLSLHNYHDIHGCLPPAWVGAHPKADSEFHFGWQTFVLPMIEEAALYSTFDYEDPTAESNAKGLLTAIRTYRCPSDTTPGLNTLRDGLATSNYSGNFGSVAAPRLLPGRLSDAWPGHADTPRMTDGMMFCNSAMRFRDMTDGLSNILMVGERGFRSRAGIWGGVGGNHFEDDAVTDTSHRNRPGHGINSFSSSHGADSGEGGINICIGDGSVRYISYRIESLPASEGMGIWQKLGSRNDGNPLEDY